MTKKPAVFFGFSTWKDCVPYWFPEYDTKVETRNPWLLLLRGWPFRLLLLSNVTVHVWGFKYPSFLKKFCNLLRIKFVHVEDGFLRSRSLAGPKTPPISITIDSSTMHFDRRKSSDLENLLNNFDFDAHPALITRARQTLHELRNSDVSKYNIGNFLTLDEVIGEKKQRRVLVIGQVEDDASVQYGCEKPLTNNDLVRAAFEENSSCEIIYRPHPDVLCGKRPRLSNPDEVADICRVLTENISAPATLKGVDHVYTMTSLMGFEAVIAGKKVSCFGMPFYAGWGLTDDRQTSTRRQRHLKLEEVFAASYILYPRYFDLDNKSITDIEAAINYLKRYRKGEPSFGKSDFKD